MAGLESGPSLQICMVFSVGVMRQVRICFYAVSSQGCFGGTCLELQDTIKGVLHQFLTGMGEKKRLLC